MGLSDLVKYRHRHIYFGEDKQLGIYEIQETSYHLKTHCGLIYLTFLKGRESDKNHVYSQIQCTLTWLGKIKMT